MSGLGDMKLVLLGGGGAGGCPGGPKRRGEWAVKQEDPMMAILSVHQET